MSALPKHQYRSSLLQFTFRQNIIQYHLKSTVTMNKWRLLLLSVLSLLQSVSTERNFVDGRYRFPPSAKRLLVHDSYRIYESLPKQQKLNVPEGFHYQVRDGKLMRSLTRQLQREHLRQFPSTQYNRIALTDQKHVIVVENLSARSQHERNFVRQRINDRNEASRLDGRTIRISQHVDSDYQKKSAPRYAFRDRHAEDKVRSQIHNIEKHVYTLKTPLTRDNTFSIRRNSENVQDDKSRFRPRVILQRNNVVDDNAKNYNVQRKRNTDTRISSQAPMFRQNYKDKYNVKVEHSDYPYARSSLERYTINLHNIFEIRKDVSRRNIATLSDLSTQRENKELHHNFGTSRQTGNHQVPRYLITKHTRYNHGTSNSRLMLNNEAARKIVTQDKQVVKRNKFRLARKTHTLQTSRVNIEEDTIQRRSLHACNERRNRRPHLARTVNTRFGGRENDIRDCNTQILTNGVRRTERVIRETTEKVHRNRLQILAVEEQVILAHRNIRNNRQRNTSLSKVNTENIKRERSRILPIERRPTNTHRVTRYDISFIPETNQFRTLRHDIKKDIRLSYEDSQNQRIPYTRHSNVFNDQRQYVVVTPHINIRSMKNIKNQDIFSNNMFTDERATYELQNTRISRTERQTARNERAHILSTDVTRRNEVQNIGNNQRHRHISLRHRTNLPTDQQNSDELHRTRNMQAMYLVTRRSPPLARVRLNSMSRLQNNQRSTQYTGDSIQYRSLSLPARNRVSNMKIHSRNIGKEEFRNSEEIRRDRSRSTVTRQTLTNEMQYNRNTQERVLETRHNPLVREIELAKLQTRYVSNRAMNYFRDVRRFRSRSLSTEKTVVHDTQKTRDGRRFNKHRELTSSNERQYLISNKAVSVELTENTGDIRQYIFRESSTRQKVINEINNNKYTREDLLNTRHVIFYANKRNSRETENRHQTKYHSTEERIAYKLQNTRDVRDKRLLDTRVTTTGDGEQRVNKRFMDGFDDIRNDGRRSISRGERVTNRFSMNRNNIQSRVRDHRAIAQFSLRYNPTENNVKTEGTVVFKWQYILYLLQGIYICCVIMKTPKENKEFKKKRIAPWFTRTDYLKVD